MQAHPTRRTLQSQEPLLHQKLVQLQLSREGEGNMPPASPVIIPSTVGGSYPTHSAALPSANGGITVGTLGADDNNGVVAASEKGGHAKGPSES